MPLSTGSCLEDLLAALADEHFEVRCQALDLLEKRADLTPPVLPRLLPSLEDPAWQVRSTAARALTSLGRGQAPVVQALLARALHDPHLWVRHAALGGLEATAPASDGLRAPLLEALAAPLPALRLRALQALGRLRLFSDETLQALVTATRDAEWEVRAGAVRTLGESGQGAPHGVRAVSTALGDADPAVREAACEALTRLSPLSPQDLEALERTASDGEPQVRIACARALGRLSARAQQKLLKDGDERVREAAVVALGQAGPEAMPPSLWTEFLEDPSLTVRQAAESFLVDARRAGADLEPILAETLAHRARSASVVHVLSRTGVSNTSTFDTLSGVLLKLGERTTRDVAAHLVAANEGTALPHLLEALRHRDVRIRHRAARALGFFVLDSSTAARGVPMLDEALRDPSEQVRRAAAESLGRVGLPALPAYPGLIRRAFEYTELVPPRARKALRLLRTPLPPDWVFPEESRREGAERLFLRWIGPPMRLSPAHDEELRRICLARERWHLQLCRNPPPPPQAMAASLRDAASRAAEAAMIHGASRRRRTRPETGPRDREREFTWLLGRLHALAMQGLVKRPTP